MTGSATGQRQQVVLIAAVARDGAIGRGNALLWSHPEDLRHLRSLTLGHAVVMGRRTWDSLPPRFRPLPGRRNVVLSRNPDWQGDGAEVAQNLTAALELLADAPLVCVIGGAQAYAQALPLATRLELTEIDAVFDSADTHFPRWDPAAWVETARRTQHADNGVRFDFVSRMLRSAAPAD